MILTSQVEIDDAVLDACRPFDYKFEGFSKFEVPSFNAPIRDGSWNIGLIIGPSGSGKTSILKNSYGLTSRFNWNKNKAIASQVHYSKLSAVGLNSVPVWCRPFSVLSNGEAFRASMAAELESNTSFDEFTSVVDRSVAKSCSHALQRYIRQMNMTGVVFASCHYDIVEWLQPDWLFDITTGEISLRGSLRCRPAIDLKIFECDRRNWKIFRQHHYLSGELNKSSRCYIATWNNIPVGFTAVLAYPSGTVKNAWREHRTVVLPDFQGLGLGVRLSDFIADMYVKSGCRFFSKTAHPRMGEYREKSRNWKPTSKNKKTRLDYKPDGKGKEANYKMNHSNRLCYSHEYILKN